jgi:hypothetical protein
MYIGNSINASKNSRQDAVQTFLKRRRSHCAPNQPSVRYHDVSTTQHPAIDPPNSAKALGTSARCTTSAKLNQPGNS